MIIYKIINKINGKIYIGQTSLTVEKRFRSHIFRSRDKKYQVNNHLYNSIRKYGKENFEIKLLCKCYDKNEINEMEKAYIWSYNSFHAGMNNTTGGNINYVLSETSRKKMSDYAKNRTKSHIEKNANSRRGYKHSEETKKKWSQKRKGIKTVPCSEAKKIKIGKANSGKNNGLYRHDLNDYEIFKLMNTKATLTAMSNELNCSTDTIKRRFNKIYEMETA